jgi:hypothetical protein
MAINEFESYESATERSNHPLTSEFAEVLSEKMTVRRFRNLEVRYDPARP